MTVQVQATSGSLGVTAWYLFANSGQAGYSDWLDLFVAAQTSATPTPTPSASSWWGWLF